MKCDNCGREFHGPATEDTHSVGPSFHRGNELEKIILCPECAKSRQTMLPFILGAICITTAVLTVLSLLLKW
jgi:rubredoxin